MNKRASGASLGSQNFLPFAPFFTWLKPFTLCICVCASVFASVCVCMTRLFLARWGTTHTERTVNKFSMTFTYRCRCGRGIAIRVAIAAIAVGAQGRGDGIGAQLGVPAAENMT